MALSEEEQRLLDQMEAALAAEDPRLANTLRGTSNRSQRRRAVLAGLGFLVGIACLIGGMQVHPALSVVGFLVMLAAAVLGITAWQQAAMAGDAAGNGGRAGGHSEFMGRMEDRWRRGQDDGL
jgi:ferric-dicitrate binding protein FerR (iron transport regulator)